MLSAMKNNVNKILNHDLTCVFILMAPMEGIS